MSDDPAQAVAAAHKPSWMRRRLICTCGWQPSCRRMPSTMFEQTEEWGAHLLATSGRLKPDTSLSTIRPAVSPEEPT